MVTDPPTIVNGQPAANAAPARPPRPEIAPLLLNVAQAAALCGTTETGWRNLMHEGRTPAPIRLRGLRWRRAELEAWIAAGCPDRLAWEARRAAQ